MANPDQRYAFKDIVTPHQNDVLYGRGGGTNNHFGNGQWRNIIAMNKKRYIRLPKRKKMLLAQNIVLEIRQKDPPGRFLQRDPKTKLWYDVGDQKARDKTSQALREGAKEIRTEMINEDSDNSDDDLIEKDQSKLSPNPKPPNKASTSKDPSPVATAAATTPVAAARPLSHSGCKSDTSSTASSQSPTTKTQNPKIRPILPQSSEQRSTVQEPKKHPLTIPPPAAIPPACPPIMKSIPLSAIANMQSAKMKGMKMPKPFCAMPAPSLTPSALPSSSKKVTGQLSYTSTSSISKIMPPPLAPPTVTSKDMPPPSAPPAKKSTSSINNNLIGNGNHQFFVPRIPPQKPFSKDAQQVFIKEDFSRSTTKTASVGDATTETASETTTTKNSDGDSSQASNDTNQSTPATAPPPPPTATTATVRTSKMISFDPQNPQILNSSCDQSSSSGSAPSSADVTTEKFVAPRVLPSKPLSKTTELGLINDDFIEPTSGSSASHTSYHATSCVRTSSNSTANTISTVSTDKKQQKINFTFSYDNVDINRMVTHECPFSDTNQELLKAVRTSLLDDDIDDDGCNTDASIFGNQSFAGEENFIGASASAKKGRSASGTSTSMERTISINMADILSLDSMDLARNESRGGQTHASIDSTNVKEIVKSAMRETTLGRGRSEAVSEMSFTGLSRDCSMDLTGLSRGNSLALVDATLLSRGNSLAFADVTGLSRGNSLALADVTMLSRGNSLVPNEVLQRLGVDISGVGTAASNNAEGTGVVGGNMNHLQAPTMSNAGGICDTARKTPTMTTFSTSTEKTSTVASHGPIGDVPPSPGIMAPPPPQRPTNQNVDETSSGRGLSLPEIPPMDETSLGRGVSFAFSDFSGANGETSTTEPSGRLSHMDETLLGRGISIAFSDFSDTH